MKHLTLRKVAIAASVFACATVLSFGWSEQGSVSLSIESAQARVGRPLTPVSVAGVARRQARRDYMVGAGVAGTAGAVAAAGIVGAADAFAAAPFAAAPYYSGAAAFYPGSGSYDYTYPGYTGGLDAYAARNSFACRPGTWFIGLDGQEHICQ